MKEDGGPSVARALLRAELRRLRTERGLTQEEVARSLDWSVSKLVRIEAGDSAISARELYSLLTFYRRYDPIGERVGLILRRLRGVCTLIRIHLIATFMSDRHQDEPADEDSSLIVINGRLAGEAA